MTEKHRFAGSVELDYQSYGAFTSHRITRYICDRYLRHNWFGIICGPNAYDLLSQQNWYKNPLLLHWKTHINN